MSIQKAVSKLKVGFAGLLLALLIPFGIVTAQTSDTSGAFYTAIITFINIAVPTFEIQAPFPISGSSLIDGSFMNDDALNTVLQSSGLDQPSMPPSNKIRMLGAVLEDSSSFTNFTTAANNAVFADVELLPDPPVNDDAFYFIGDNPFRILTLNIGQEAVYSTTGSFVYEYFDGTSFVTASGVDDRTREFTVFGVNTISFTAPTDWVKSSVCCSIPDGFVFRVRLQEAPTQTQQPLATQIWYETGLWWTWIDEMSPDDQRSFVLFLGGPDIVDHHQIFLGDEGIVTPDDPGLELGNTFGIQVQARLTPFISGACVVCKGSALRLFVSDTNELTLDVTDGVDTTSLTIPGISTPTTGSQIIGIDSDGTTLSFSITGETTVSGTAVDVQDVANNWTWSTTGATAFVEHIAISTTGVFGEFESWDQLGEWNQGLFSSVESKGGQPNLAQRYIPDAGTDDGMWQTGGFQTFFGSSTVARFGFCGPTCAGGGQTTTENAFFRFDKLEITQGTILSTAELRFHNSVAASASTNDTVRVIVSALAEDDASAPSSFADATSRVTGSASFSWDPVPGFLGNTYDTGWDFHTIDVTSVVQEVIDRPGWTFGNSIVFYVEDNGSTTANDFTSRNAATVEDRGVATSLSISYPAIEPTLSDDFIQLDQFSGQPTPLLQSFTGWSSSCTRCTAIQPRTDKSEIFGKYSLRVDARRTSSTSGQAVVWQDIPALEGEVWSFRTSYVPDAQFSTGSMHVRFLDVSDVVLETHTTSLASFESTNQVAVISGRTAPAGTAEVRIEFETGCTLSCASSSRGRHFDGVVGCVCNPAPNFPDASNRVLNPSFEEVFRSTGTWTSQTVVPPIVSSQSTAVFWDAQVLDGFSGTTESLVVSVSTTSGAPFNVVANNGDPIPGINPGDDLSQLGIQLRFSLESIGSAPTINRAPVVSEALLAFIGAADEGNSTLFYELRTTPSFFIQDLTGNGFDGDLHLPLAPILPIAIVSSLQATESPETRQREVGSPDFAAPVQEPENLLGTGGFGSNLPLAPFFALVVNLTGVPAQIFMILFAMIVTIYAGVSMYYSFQSLTTAFVAMLVSLIGFTFIDQGVIPWWVVFVYGFMGAFWVFSDRSSP